MSEDAPSAVATERAWFRMRAGLLAFFRRRVRDEHAVEDLLQETFARVHAGLGELEDETRLAAWVFRIARNVLTDHYRGGGGEEHVDPETLPERDGEAQNLNAEVEGWLRLMIAELPPEAREAVELVEIDGLAQEEVARRLGLTLSGAKSRVQRGRRRLLATLSACCRLDFDRYGNVVDYERNDGRSCDGC